MNVKSISNRQKFGAGFHIKSKLGQEVAEDATKKIMDYCNARNIPALAETDFKIGDESMSFAVLTGQKDVDSYHKTCRKSGYKRLTSYVRGENSFEASDVLMGLKKRTFDVQNGVLLHIPMTIDDFNAVQNPSVIEKIAKFFRYNFF